MTAAYLSDGEKIQSIVLQSLPREPVMVGSIPRQSLAINQYNLEVRMRISNHSWLGLSLIVILQFGCTTLPPVHQVRSAIHSEVREKQSGHLTQAQETLLSKLCPFGRPEASPTANLGYTELVVRSGYALEHSGDLKIPLWVCERLDREMMEGHFGRKNNFRPDPELKGPRSELNDYKGSGYARGHNAPADDFTGSEERLSESFYLSNMSPQLGAINSGAWAQLEKRVRRWALEDVITWVITGALLYDPAEDDPATADGWVTYLTIGAGVTVPTHLFKIIVGQNRDGRVTTTAYVVPNAKLPPKYNIDSYRKSIRWIEQRSGFNFMPELDPGESQDLEATVGPPRSP
jgi:endonuclease G, mitochondrial